MTRVRECGGDGNGCNGDDDGPGALRVPKRAGDIPVPLTDISRCDGDGYSGVEGDGRGGDGDSGGDGGDGDGDGNGDGDGVRDGRW